MEGSRITFGCSAHYVWLSNFGTSMMVRSRAQSHIVSLTASHQLNNEAILKSIRVVHAPVLAQPSATGESFVSLRSSHGCNKLHPLQTVSFPNPEARKTASASMAGTLGR